MKLAPIHWLSEWRLPLFFSFLTASVAPFSSAKAQSPADHSFCGTYTTLPPNSRQPDSLVFDRFGNKFDLTSLAISKRQRDADSDYASPGNFSLHFLGNPPAPALAAITQVFGDVSNIIQQRLAANGCGQLLPEMIDLQVVWLNFSSPDPALVAQLSLALPLPATAGAIGTPFYAGPNDPYCQEVQLDRPFIKMNGGHTIAGIADGRILINSNYAWNYNSSLPSGSFANMVDLYSVVLHEGMHVLGFASRMGFSDAYSLWDQTLRVVNNYQPGGGGANMQPALLNPSTCTTNCWQAMPGFVDIALHSCAEGNSGPEVVLGDAALAPVGGNPGGNPASPSGISNMLSHLSPTCSGQNVDYIMQPGIAHNQARRTITDAEQQIFCALGYKVASPTVACEGSYAIGSYDNTLNLTASCCPKVYYSCVGESIHISQADLLCNDVSSGTAKITRLRQFAFNPNVQITANGDGWDISLLTPQSNSLFLSVLYTIQGGGESECRMHNQYADILWFIDNCRPLLSADPCTNLLGVQNFENFNPDQTPVNNYNVWFGRPFRLEGDDNMGTPDIINANNGNNYLHLYNAPDNPNTSSTGREAVTLELRNCIEAGTDLHLAMDISRVTGTGAATLEIWGSTIAPCSVLTYPGAAIANTCGISTTCAPGKVFEPICITTIAVPNSGNFGMPNLQPAFDSTPFVWPNQTDQKVCFLTFVPSGAQNIGIGIDNLTATCVATPKITVESPSATAVCAGQIVEVTFTACVSGIPPGSSSLLNPAISLPTGWTLVSGSVAPFSLLADECTTLHFQLMVPSEVLTGSISDVVLNGTATGTCTSLAWQCSAKLTVTDCAPPAGFICACGPGGLNIDAGEAPTDPKESIPGLSVYATALSGGQATQNWYNNLGKCIAIRGHLTISAGFDLTIEGGEINMQPGAKIIVQAGATLTLKDVNGGNLAEPTQLGIHGCEKMWRSITVQAGGELHLSGNIIQDAEYAVDVQGGSTMPSFNAFNNDFDRNHVSIHVSGAVIQPLPFQNNTFHATTALLPLYSSGISNWHPLYPFTGMDLALTTFTVGQAQDASSENRFTGLRNGILAATTDLHVYYAKFTALSGAINYNQSPDAQNPQGIGIFSKNGGTLTVHHSIFGGDSRNIGCRAIHVARCNLEAKWNDMFDLASGVYALPAGQATSIVIDDNDFRVTLPDFPVGQSAFIVNNTNAVTNIAIENNNIHIKGNGPGILLSNGLQKGNTASQTVSGNYIYHSYRFQAGISVEHSSGWSIDDNHIFYSGFPQGNLFAQFTRGIFLSASNQCLLRGNEIRATDGSLIGASMNGIELLGSKGSTLCCNLTDKTTTGNYFMGNCDPTYVRSSQFYDHHIGLQCDGVGTVIGEQNWMGNQWLGSYGMLGALHTGSPANVSASAFRIELPQTNPTWPISCVPDNLGVWFIPAEGTSGSCADCPVTAPSGLESPRDLTDNEKRIARDQYASEHPYDRTTQREGERSLYREIKSHPALYGQDMAVDKFFATARQEAIGQLYAVENQMTHLGIGAKGEHLLMVEIARKLDSLAQMRNEIDLRYARARNQQDSAALRQQKAACFTAARPLLEKWLQLSQANETNLIATMASVLRQNEAIAADNEWTSNRKTVNRIYLETMLRPTYTATPQQMTKLLSLARQCMLSGGEAVLEARALYNSFAEMPLAFNDADICERDTPVGETATIQERTKVAYQASILPNPARDRFTVQLQGTAPDAMLRVQITGMNGAILKEMILQNGSMLPINCLPGLYFCRIYVGEMLADVVKLVIVP